VHGCTSPGLEGNVTLLYLKNKKNLRLIDADADA